MAVLVSLAIFAAIRLRESPARRDRASRFPLQVAHRPGLGHPRHDRPGHRHPAALPGGQAARAPSPTTAGPSPRRPGGCWTASPQRPCGCSMRASCLPTWRSCLVPGAGHVLQAPAHLHRPVQRRLLPPPQGLGPLATTRIDPEEMTEEASSAPARSRTSTSSSCWTWPPAPRRPLPGPVPGLEHRVAVAQAGHHRPARPPVREGPVPARRGDPREPRAPRPGRARQGPGPGGGGGRRPLVLHHLRGRCPSSAWSTSSTSTPFWSCAATRS